MGREARHTARSGPKPVANPPGRPSEKEQAQAAVQQLDAIISKASMPRETHAACQMASQFLLAFIEKA